MMILPKNNLFKWIGGKKWLSLVLNEQFNTLVHKNKNINSYIEPFCGGLGSFISLLPQLLEKNITHFYLNDINKNLITVYKTITTNIDLVSLEYQNLEKQFLNLIPNEALSLHVTKDKIILKDLLKDCYFFYEKIKKEFNKNNTNCEIQAAYFIFLMTHAFNGIYRENLKGEFNTSFNWDNKIINVAEKLALLRNYYILFNTFDIKFSCEDAFTFIKKHSFNQQNLFYFDPPYINNEDFTNHQNKYNKKEFNLKNQEELLSLLKDIPFYLYSNHKINLIEEYFQNNNISYTTLYRRNTISGKIEDRKKEIPEILAIKGI